MFFVGAPTLLAQCTLPAPCRSLSTPLSVIPSLGLAELSSNEEPGLHYDEFPGLDYRCSPVTSEGTIWEADDMPFICSSTLQSTGETYHSETWPQNRIVCYGLEAPIPFFPENSTGTIDQRHSALTSSSGTCPLINRFMVLTLK
ncbi:hypothetical protein AX16_006163 [Volvariella volvacea WC 439]|nr:hypothetical protein AX16_006163 [Volvariella volvacea WC 439]